MQQHSADSTPSAYALNEVLPDDDASVSDVAGLHMELLDFGPMAGLGERFIKDVGYKIHLEDDLLRVLLCRVEGRPAGFVAYTSRSISFHRSSLASHWLRVGWVLATALLREPRRIAALGRAVRVILSRRGEEKRGHDPMGEVVAIAVKREFLTREFVQATGVKLSEMLVRAASSRLQRAGVEQMRMLVDADNRAALFLYHGLGAKMQDYVQAGEPMVEVWFDLRPEDEGSADVPQCWRNSMDGNGQDDSDWSAYWEGLEDDQPIFRAESQDYVRRLREDLRPGSGARVLDFGCGFGFGARELAPAVGEMFVWDSSGNMRSRARLNLGHIDNVRFLDLADAENGPDGPQFDFVLVNSVVQYMTDDELLSWLSRWRTMLAPQGQLVVSDIIRTDYQFLPDMAAFMWFSAKQGFLVRSIIKGISELRNYRQMKSAQPLARRDPDELRKMGRDTGLDVEILDRNLTFHAGRTTAVFRPSPQFPPPST